MSKIICAECGEIMEKEGETKATVYFPNRYTYTEGNINRCECGCDQTVLYGNSIISIVKGKDGVWYNLFKVKPIKNGDEINKSNVLADEQYYKLHPNKKRNVS